MPVPENAMLEMPCRSWPGPGERLGECCIACNGTGTVRLTALDVAKVLKRLTGEPGESWVLDMKEGAVKDDWWQMAMEVQAILAALEKAGGA